jgi:polyhydroxyalkanoate synthase
MKLLLNQIQEKLLSDVGLFLKYQNFYLSSLLKLNTKLNKTKDSIDFQIICNHHDSLTETVLEFIKIEINSRLDKLSQRKTLFFTKLFMDSYSPKNFPFSNINFLKYSLENNFANLTTGFSNFLQDINDGKLNHSGKEDFVTGQNIAYTKGKIVFKNHLFELICYKSENKTTNSMPILLVPACINKYYILDLQEENSLVNWLTQNNYQVFVISWFNPNNKSTNHGFSNYIVDGVNLAITKITEEYKFKQLHLAGYCLGGIFTAISTSMLKEQNKIKSLSSLTAQLDFSEPNDFSMFFEPQSWEQIKNSVDSKNMMSGHDMQSFFNFIKSKEMIYQYIIDSYFYGKPKEKIDFLAWNGDSTNITPQFYKDYIEYTYINDLIAQPNKLKIDNKPINLQEIEIPTFFLATINDHIVPWNDAYRSMQLFQNSKKHFILGGSGHVAGVINPPSKNKYKYWIDNESLNKSHAEWQETAKEFKGSWWVNWLEWLNKQNDSTIPNKYNELPMISDAPGEYINQKM